MSAPHHVVRRATLEDLPSLVALWEVARLPVLEYERHLTDFQLLLRADGPLLGAVGLQVVGPHGRVYGEAFFSHGHEAEHRPLLWQRLTALARSRGLLRLWTVERAPFWHEHGFAPATPEERRKLPAAFGDAHGPWQTVALKDETAIQQALQREFEGFIAAERQESERLLRLGQFLKWLAIVLALALFGAAFYQLLRLLRYRRSRQSG